MELTNSIKQRFVKDFKLPINLIQEPYFDYFIELYNPDFDTYKKLELLQSFLNTCKDQEDFFQKGTTVSTAVKEFIQNSKAYELMNNADLNSFPQNKNLTQQNIYIVPNVDKELISIDLEKANFNSFKLFNFEEETGIKTYRELISKFTDQEYFQQSKMFRQVIFGDLNPARQQRIQKYVIGQLCQKLQENGCEISSASSDEIIVKNKSSTSEVEQILATAPKELQFFRVEKFHFSRIGDDFDFFVKYTEQKDGSIKKEFKNSPGHLFPQIYKQHLKLELNQYDMLFYHDGYLAEFKEPVFKNEPTLTSKRKI